MAHHLRQHNAAHDHGPRHGKGRARFSLACGHGQNSSAKRLCEIRPKNKANRQHTCQKWRNVDVAPALCVRNLIDRYLPAVKNQQHQHQLRHAANQRGVDISRPARSARARELGCSSGHAKDAGNGQRECRHLQGQHQAFQDGGPITIEQHDKTPVARQSGWTL